MTELSYQEELRYNRQIMLKAIDFEGQETLKQSKMLIVGLGGLGCAASQYLATAGVDISLCWILIRCRCRTYNARCCTITAV